MNTTLKKQSIIKSFSQHAQSYDANAAAQQKSAQLLIEFIHNEQSLNAIPPGSILEIGCGTGIFTEHLTSAFSNRDLVVSDISSSMIELCKLKLGKTDRISFQQIDAEAISLNHRFAVICSSFSLQWMSDFEATLQKLLNHLQPQGQLFIAIPIEGCFNEWREQCELLAVPFTANSLPNPTKLSRWCEQKNTPINMSIKTVTTSFDSSLAFFKSLKNLGAALNTNGQHLTAAQLRRLTCNWDASVNGSVEVTYKVLCAKMTKGSVQ